MSCTFPRCLCDVSTVGCVEMPAPKATPEPEQRKFTLADQVAHCRQRGYEVVEILRKGAIMKRTEDGAEILVGRNGHITRLEWGVELD